MEHRVQVVSAKWGGEMQQGIVPFLGGVLDDDFH
jgi:hypothetical protein